MQRYPRGGLTSANDRASHVKIYRNEDLTQFPVVYSSKNLDGTKAWWIGRIRGIISKGRSQSICFVPFTSASCRISSTMQPRVRRKSLSTWRPHLPSPSLHARRGRMAQGQKTSCLLLCPQFPSCLNRRWPRAVSTSTMMILARKATHQPYV